MRAKLEWFGTATWRLTVGETVIWLDAYINRASTAEPLPCRAEEVDRADYILIGHSHFDHVADAGIVANRTGATVIGSALTCEIVTEEGVPVARTIACTGGEVLALGPVTVHVFPSLHGFNRLVIGDQPPIEWPDPEGRTIAERTAILREQDPEGAANAAAHLRNIPPKQSQDGGPLAFLLQWDDYRLFWHDTPGMVRASWEAAADLEPDLALLAAAAAFSTPNIDGEPCLEGHQEFVAQMAAILQPGAVILNHHDDWCPPLTFHVPEETFRPNLELVGIQLRRAYLGEPIELS
jgi:hypothetical protein